MPYLSTDVVIVITVVYAVVLGIVVIREHKKYGNWTEVFYTYVPEEDEKSDKTREADKD